VNTKSSYIPKFPERDNLREVNGVSRWRGLGGKESMEVLRVCKEDGTNEYTRFSSI
jgi:hypothetical protein